MSSSALEVRLRALQKLNKACFNCAALGTAYIVPTYGVFVCTECSGKHMNAGHRVKSVSMGKYTVEEVKSLEGGGNELAWRLYLSKWKSDKDTPRPTDRDGKKIESWIRAVFSEKRFYNETEQQGITAADIETIPVKDASELVGKMTKLQVLSTDYSSPPKPSPPAVAAGLSPANSAGGHVSSGAPSASPVIFDPFGVSSPVFTPAAPAAAGAGGAAAGQVQPISWNGAVPTTAPVPSQATVSPSNGADKGWASFAATSVAPARVPGAAAPPLATASSAEGWSAFEDATPFHAAAAAQQQQRRLSGAASPAPAFPHGGTGSHGGDPLASASAPLPAPPPAPAGFAPWGNSSDNGRLTAASETSAVGVGWSRFDDAFGASSTAAAPVPSPGIKVQHSSEGAATAAFSPDPHAFSSPPPAFSPAPPVVPAAWRPQAAAEAGWSDFEDAPFPVKSAPTQAAAHAAPAPAPALPVTAVASPVSPPPWSPLKPSASVGASRMAELPSDLFSDMSAPAAPNLYTRQGALLLTAGTPAWSHQPQQQAAAAAPSWQPQQPPAAAAPSWQHQPQPAAAAPSWQPQQQSAAVAPSWQPQPQSAAVAPSWQPQPQPAAAAPSWQPQPQPAAAAPSWQPQQQSAAVAPSWQPQPQSAAVAPSWQPQPQPAAAAPSWKPQPQPAAATPSWQPQPQPQPAAAAPSWQPQPQPAVAVPSWQHQPQPAAAAPSWQPQPQPAAAAPSWQPQQQSAAAAGPPASSFGAGGGLNPRSQQQQQPAPPVTFQGFGVGLLPHFDAMRGTGEPAGPVPRPTSNPFSGPGAPARDSNPFGPDAPGFTSTNPFGQGLPAPAQVSLYNPFA